MTSFRKRGCFRAAAYSEAPAQRTQPLHILHEGNIYGNPSGLKFDGRLGQSHVGLNPQHFEQATPINRKFRGRDLLGGGATCNRPGAMAS